jgi:hypothetical protein
MKESCRARLRKHHPGWALGPVLLMAVLGTACGDSPLKPGTELLDQENLLEGSLAGQGIGRFSDLNGDPDPTGSAFDYQDAQTFTAGVSGRLSRVTVALRNLGGATDPVVVELREIVGGGPDSVDSRVLGSVTVGAADVAPSMNGDPSTWPSFDVASLGIDVIEGHVYAFAVRSVSTIPYLLNPELTMGYDRGEGYRRNRALGAGWLPLDWDFGFQTFVLVS